MTADRRFWPVDAEMVFLGDWCLEGLPVGVEWPTGAAVLPSPWDVERDIDQAAQYLDAFMERSLQHLAPRLNDIHRVRYDLRSWRILAGNWLLHAVHGLYDRFRLLTSALEIEPRLWTSVPLSSDDAPFATTRSFKDAQLHPDTSLVLFGRLVEAMGIPCERLSAPAVEPEVTVYGPKRVLEPKRVAKTLVRAIIRSRSRADILFFATAISRPTLRAIHAGRTIIQGEENWRPRRGNATDMDLRRALFRDLPADDEFATAAARSFPYLLPTSLLEDFPLWRDQARDMRWATNVKTIVTSYGLSGNDLSSHYLVRLLGEGSILYSMQHGGGYGSFRYCPEEAFEAACADGYLTWGWNSEPRHVPLPALSLVDAAKVARNADPARVSDRIVLVGTDRPALTHRIMSHPLTGQISRYFAWQERFYDALSPEVKGKLHVKPYGKGFAPGAKWWDRRSVPSIGGTLRETIRQNGLLVFDHNSTGYLEALSLDVPCVAFWDPALWELRDSVLPYFDQLRDAKIFHTSPESAAAHVSGLAGAVAAWWSDARTRSARAKFCHVLARTGEGWALDWRRFLQRPGET
jgi:putative transferase (TIGR04331 family)